MQTVTAYSNQRLKTTAGGGEERKKKSKPHLTSFQQQTLCELQDPNCKLALVRAVPHLQGIHLWLAETSQTSFNILNGKERVNSHRCFLHVEKFGWGIWRFLGLVGAGVGLEQSCCLVFCCALCFPFRRAIWVSECKPFSGVKTLQPHLHP